jgi:hypothetical protein
VPGVVSGATAAATSYLLTREISPALVATAMILSFGLFAAEAIYSRKVIPRVPLPDLDGEVRSLRHFAVAVRKGS